MVKRHLLILAIVSIAHGFVNADGKVIQEFTDAEIFYRFNNPPLRNTSKMLRSNVESAIVSVLSRYPTEEKDLNTLIKSSNIDIERVVATQLVYAVYKDYIFEFRFAKDPNKFHQTPTEFKVWKKPKELNKQTELNSSSE